MNSIVKSGLGTMAVLRSFLKEQGISAGGVLWLDGKVSSGKTELAIMCVPYIWGK